MMCTNPDRDIIVNVHWWGEGVNGSSMEAATVLSQ